MCMAGHAAAAQTSATVPSDPVPGMGGISPEGKIIDEGSVTLGNAP